MLGHQVEGRGERLGQVGELPHPDRDPPLVGPPASPVRVALPDPEIQVGIPFVLGVSGIAAAIARVSPGSPLRSACKPGKNTEQLGFCGQVGVKQHVLYAAEFLLGCSRRPWVAEGRRQM